VREPSLPAWALLLAGAAVGLLPSQDLAVSLFKLASIAVAAILFQVIRRLNPRGLERLSVGLLTAGVAAAIAGNVLLDRNSAKLNGLNTPVYALFEHVPRFSELAMSQNGLAAFLILVIPFAIALRKWPLAIFLGLELLLTDSRAAILSLALALALLGWRWTRAWWWAGPAAALASAALIAAGALGMPSTGERLAIWQSSLYMLADRPLTGIGMGMFQRAYPEYILPAYHNTHPHAHNLFLQTWLDAGLLGVMGMLAIAVLAVACIAQARDRLAVGAAVCTAAVLLHAQVDSYFAGDPRTYWLMFVPLGVLAARVGPIAIPRPAWAAVGVPLLLLPLTQATWLAERRLGLETGDPRYLQAALRDGPQTERAHFELAQALFASGHPTEAIPEWRQAHAAPYLVRQGLFDLALAVDPDDPEAREGSLWTPVRPRLPEDQRGRGFELSGQDSRAEQEYLRLADLDSIGFYRLGQLYLRTGRLDEAVSELRRAVRGIPNQEDFRLALARAYSAAGQEDEAQREYGTVLTLDPGSTEARRALT